MKNLFKILSVSIFLMIFFHLSRLNSKRILIIGDSITKGTGATDNYGYAQMVKSNFDFYKVTISGIGGSNINDINARFRKLKKNRYDVIILQIGGNDSRYRPSLGTEEVILEDFVEGIEEFVETVNKYNGNCIIYCLTLTRVDQSKTTPFKPDKFYTNKSIARYESALVETIERIGERIITIPHLNGKPELLVDGLHPSDTGYEQIYSVVSKHLK